MKTGDELADLDATAQAELVREGTCTPLELVEAAIARIEAVNPSLNAVIHPLFDKARATASGDGLEDGPFRGVPMAIKDVVCHTAGDPYHAGMRFLRDRNWRAPDDAYLARRFRRGGFVIVGRTNTPELAASCTTEPLAYGPSRNPWNTDHSTGGSSGGSGAAVAAGLVPVAHGNDMGGSIRIPSSECGLVGLKPTRARSSLGPNFGQFWGPFTHEGVLTRSVRDSAALLDVIRGFEPGDPAIAPPPLRPFADEVGADPGRLRIGLRIATPGTCEAPHPECEAAVRSAAALLESLGHVVEEAAPATFDQTEGPFTYAGLFTVAIARDVERWGEIVGEPVPLDELEPVTALMTEAGRGVSGTAYMAALEGVERLARSIARWWVDDDFDLLLTPTLAELPPKIGDVGPLTDPSTYYDRMGRIAAFMSPFNITGQPAVSLPLHWSAEGLPVGIQLGAPFGREDLLVQVASQLEAARPWADRRPPVHAARAEEAGTH